MDIKDLTGLSKPLTRLVEVTSQGVGAVSTPFLIRKEAKARAVEIGAISEAIKSATGKNNLQVSYKDGKVEIWHEPEDRTLITDEMTINQRADVRVNYQERKRQANVENVTSIAACELADEETVTDEMPDNDWVTRFFAYAQDVSADQMQDLWGRILAGEIKRPGAFSLRTLDFIRNLTQADAELVNEIGKLAIRSDEFAFVDASDGLWLENERKIDPQKHIKLAELGLLYPAKLQILVPFDESTPEETFRFGDYALHVKRGGIIAPVPISVLKFTTIGSELLPLVHPDFDEEYLECFGQNFARHGGIAFIAKIANR